MKKEERKGTNMCYNITSCVKWSGVICPCHVNSTKATTST